ncbi:hypothetical protein ACFVUY_36595 [Kitasatospora sp. NPDC058063]
MPGIVQLSCSVAGPLALRTAPAGRSGFDTFLDIVSRDGFGRG